MSEKLATSRRSVAAGRNGHCLEALNFSVHHVGLTKQIYQSMVVGLKSFNFGKGVLYFCFF